MIEAKDLVVHRGGRLVLDRVSLRVPRGKTMGIVGPNGSGKTTLLLALHCALPRQGGSVLFDGDDADLLTRKQIARRVAVVSQTPGSILPLAVRDMVALGRLPHRSLLRYGDLSDREIVETALRQANVLDLADRLVSQLSGGERQRVLIARAIAQQTDYLLLDEPTNHLDIHHQFQLLKLINDLDATTVVVLHDLNLAAEVCDELLLLEHGRLVASGPTVDVLDPGLISHVYKVDARQVVLDGQPRLVFRPRADAEA